MRIGIVVLMVALSTVAACATVEQHARVSRPINAEAFASVGDVVVRVEVSENLPNAFGRSDIFGRTRERGFSEVRFMGLTSDNLAIFRRRDVDIQTNETTVNTMGLGTAAVSVERSGSGLVGTGIYTHAPAPNIQALPPDTIEFALDLRQGRLVTIRDRTIEVLDATPSGVRFIVR